MEILGLDKIKCSNEVNITGLDNIKTEPDLPQISSFTVELINLVNLARELDTECEEFGANRHKYEFNPVIPLSKVRDFEQRHKIKIPQGYVDFLTQVGNGGAGPDYGLYSLEELEYHNFYAHARIVSSKVVENEPDYYTYPYTIDGKPVMLDSKFTEEKWNDWDNRFEELIDDNNDEEYDKMYSELYNGLLEIVYSGCSYCVMLICGGDMCGEVWKFERGLDCCPYPIKKTFEEWVLSHFRRIVAKYEKH